MREHARSFGESEDLTECRILPSSSEATRMPAQRKAWFRVAYLPALKTRSSPTPGWLTAYESRESRVCTATPRRRRRAWRRGSAAASRAGSRPVSGETIWNHEDLQRPARRFEFQAQLVLDQASTRPSTGDRLAYS